MAQQQAVAAVVRDLAARLLPHRVRAWLLDLRLNDDGAMVPMLADIAPLLRGGHLGGFVDYKGQAQEQWYLRQGNFYPDTLTIMAPLAPAVRVPSNRPTAVLLSGLTTSSGEIVAIGLQDRPVTRFFGKPTYGVTTANTSYQIQGTSHLTVANSVDADRNGHIYPFRIQPDEKIINGDNFLDLQQDTKVLAAL